MRSKAGRVPPHDECETTELDQIATEQQDSLERLFALAAARVSGR